MRESVGGWLRGWELAKYRLARDDTEQSASRKIWRDCRMHIEEAPSRTSKHSS